MLKRASLSWVVVVSVGIFLASPAQAAPTLRQQVTFADGLVKMAEGMNDGCAALISVYDTQAIGTKSASAGDLAFGGYFGCAMSQLFSFYADFWAPGASLKNIQVKMVKLSDGLAGSLKYAMTDSTSTAHIKLNIEKNKTLIVALKKDLAAFKKKNPSTAKTDDAFVKKIAAKEKSRRGVSIKNGYSVSCGQDDTCFEKKFASCSPAWMKINAGGYYDLEYKIIGKVKGGCKIQISQKMDYLGLLAGKSMSCVYDNKKDFLDEMARVGDEIVKNDQQKICSGLLLDYTKKQYQVLRSNSFTSSILDLQDKVSGQLLEIHDDPPTTTTPVAPAPVTPAPFVTVPTEEVLSSESVLDCSEIDGGKIFFARGTTHVTFNDGLRTHEAHNDYCTDNVDGSGETQKYYGGKYLVENYCDASGNWTRARYTCAHGCAYGECVNMVPEGTCFDSDGGSDIYAPGYTRGLHQETGTYGVAYDACYGNKIYENFCANGYMVRNTFACPDGYRCQEGMPAKCVVATTPLAKLMCIDTDPNQDIFARGMLFGTTGVGQYTDKDDPQLDKCASDAQHVNTLYQPYCLENGLIALKETVCTNGCVDGVCLTPPGTPAPTLNCSDTDAGQNYSVRGTVSGYLGDGHNTPAIVSDYCSNNMQTGAESATGAYVSEYYCNSGGYFNRAWNTCPNGCADGKCK